MSVDPAVAFLEEARQFVESSDDRRENFIVIDDVRLALEKKATLVEAKAQAADALWAVQKILARGVERKT